MDVLHIPEESIDTVIADLLRELEVRERNYQDAMTLRRNLSDRPNSKDYRDAMRDTAYAAGRVQGIYDAAWAMGIGPKIAERA